MPFGTKEKSIMELCPSSSIVKFEPPERLFLPITCCSMEALMHRLRQFFIRVVCCSLCFITMLWKRFGIKESRIKIKRNDNYVGSATIFFPLKRHTILLFSNNVDFFLVFVYLLPFLPVFLLFFCNFIFFVCDSLSFKSDMFHQIPVPGDDF